MIVTQKPREQMRRISPWLSFVSFLFISQISAQEIEEISPYTDTRMGGDFLDALGRGTDDIDHDLLVIREGLDPILENQSIYFRSYDGSGDSDRIYVFVELEGAEITDVLQNTDEVVDSDTLFAIGNIDDYGGAEGSRGLEATDPLVVDPDQRSLAASFGAINGVDDFRILLEYLDLDPSALQNIGNVSLKISVFAGGAVSGLAPDFLSGTNVGIRVGNDSFDASLDDGDYEILTVEPEGLGGFTSPSITQTITVRILFEDLDVFPETIDGDVKTGQSFFSFFTIDNFGLGTDLDQDNGFDQNGSLPVVPNLPLMRLRTQVSPLISLEGELISPTIINIPNNLGSLDIGDSTNIPFSLKIPEETIPGLYFGEILVWEDNNNNGIPDPEETLDSFVLSLQISPNLAPNGDEDQDGLSNGIEEQIGTDPLNPDTDNDGLSDGTENFDQDAFIDPNETDPLNPDTDGDGLLDGTEVNGDNETDPLNSDTDSDGLPDGCEDRNQNGAFNNNETDPNLIDTDLDEIPDGDEDLNGNCSLDPGETDPTDIDSDDGGEKDGSEVQAGRDPLDPSDDLLELGIFTIGGGACMVAPVAPTSSWGTLFLLLFVLLLCFTKKRYLLRW